MKQILIPNRKLNSIFTNKQNLYLSQKLKKAKSLLNIKCPESFLFYKNQFLKTQNQFDLLKGYESKTIFSSSIKHCEIKVKKSLKETPYFYKSLSVVNKRVPYTNEQKLQLNRDNNFLKKRIQVQASSYNLKNFEKDFKKSRTYKRNKCIFPSIDFIKMSRFTLTSDPTRYIL